MYKLIIFLSLLPFSTLSASSSDDNYLVTRYSDYLEIGKCKISASIYEHAMRAAIRHLIFSKDHISNELYADAEYAQRHSRDFFTPLLRGEFGQGCLTPSLRNITQALRFPEDRSVLRAADAQDISVAFPVMSRKAYTEATACLVSPSTWQHFQNAFEALVLGYGDFEYGQKAMLQFLQELGEGRHTDNGSYLDSRCLIPEIKKLAHAARVLDEDGRFKLK
jgi:hypothetical protein